jgi:hypothetical protein
MTRHFTTLLALTVLGAVLGLAPGRANAADGSPLSRAPRKLPPLSGHFPSAHRDAQTLMSSTGYAQTLQGAVGAQAPGPDGALPSAPDGSTVAPTNPNPSGGFNNQSGNQLLGDGTGMTPQSLAGSAAAPPPDQGGAQAPAPSPNGPAAAPPAQGAPPPTAAPAQGAPAQTGVAVQGGAVQGTAVQGAVVQTGVATTGVAVGSRAIAGRTNCSHVIGLLMRHCLGNGSIDPCVKNRFTNPYLFHATWMPPPALGPFPAGFGPGDLELLGVGVLHDATPELGPIYQVTFRNNSRVAVSDFRLSLVAVLGQIDESSPIMTVDVPKVAPGATATIEVKMPVTVMALGPQGQTVPFDTLVVALDSFDELIENNELNNMAILKRVDVKEIVVETAVAGGVVNGGAVSGGAVNGAPAAAPPATAAPPAGGQESIPAPAPGGGAAPQDGNAAPAPNANPNGNANIDIDSLDLGDTATDNQPM